MEEAGGGLGGAGLCAESGKKSGTQRGLHQLRTYAKAVVGRAERLTAVVGWFNWADMGEKNLLVQNWTETWGRASGRIKVAWERDNLTLEASIEALGEPCRNTTGEGEGR